MRSFAALIAVAALTIGALASAASPTNEKRNRYKWVDGQGHLHYDDALPMEALQFGYDVVNSQGLTVKHVERAHTAEELKADKETAEKNAATKRVADAQAKSDQQMLSAYPTEHDLAMAQQSQIDMIDQSVHATEVSLQNQEKSLSEMLGHAADLDRTGKPIPPSLQQQIDTLRVTVEKQKAYIANKAAQKTADAQRFETELAHYREVQAQRAHP